ncbi:MAG TPA: YihY/virulence factor BrkB family protein [Candidatus Dormibacteraeota bacterium]|nr:YihY/virulence factor BrkB family protein [Candidatus Dormibacteraeota bacterium]
MKMPRVLSRAQQLYPVRLGRAYGESQAASYAASLAFNMFMSMFPLMLGLLAIVGLVLRNPQQQAQVQSALLSFFPPDAQAPLHKTLAGVRDRAGLLGLIGVVGLLWSGSSLFTSMEFALGQMFGATQRTFVRQRLMAFSMTGLFVVAIVLAVFANAALAFARSIPFTGPVVGAVVWILFMISIYRFVPNRTFSTLRQVWPGALVAGALAEVLTLIWPVYTALTHSFSSYGATFALFFLLATWLYFLSQLILLGAVANRMRQGTPERGGVVADPNRGVVETPGARAADEERRTAG